MLRVVEEHGLLLAYTHRPFIWQIAGFERRDGAGTTDHGRMETFYNEKKAASELHK